MRVTSFVMCASLLAGCSHEKLTPLSTSPANPYNLTTENTLPSAYYERIRPYFSSVQTQELPAKNAGMTIRYRVFLPETPPAVDKGAIVIVSGRTEGMVIYQELIYDLQKQGYRLYILDHRGQGFSDHFSIEGERDRGHVDNFNYFVEDLHNFVTHVVKEPKRYLLAHSMGGCIASLYLEEYPNDFQAAALVTPMHEPILAWQSTTKLFAWINGKIPGGLATGYGVFQHGYNPPAFSSNEITQSALRYAKNLEIYEENPKTKVGGVTHGWIRQAYAAAERARAPENARKIRVPVLLLQGGKDTVVDPAAQVEFCKNVKRCTGYVIEGARHAVFNEADVYRIPALTAILDFFEKA